MVDSNRDADRAAKARYRAKNRDKINMWAKNYRQRNKTRLVQYNAELRRRNPIRTLYNASKQRAKRIGVDFDISYEEFSNLFDDIRCAVSGVELSFTYDKGPFIPTVDRIVNKLGYVSGNCRVVCWAFNRAKADWDDQTVLAWAKGFVERSDENI